MIPNIVYGKGISGALAYSMGQGNDADDKTKRLELAPGDKSRATLLGGQGFGFEIDSPERLELARRVMEWQALPDNQGSKTRKQDLDCLHASLSWNPGEKPSREEMLQAGTEFLKAIGLEKARAVFVAHDDTDHAHIHIVASRIDPETGKTLRVDFDKQEAQVWALAWEKAHGQEREAGKGLHALRDAVQAHDADAVLSHLTRDKATFQAWEVNRALQYGGLKGEARDEFRAEIIGHQNTIGLRDTAQDPVTRYTTRQALGEEMAVQRSAAQLAEDKSHGLDAKRIDRAARDHTLKAEQADALRHLTAKEGFAILWGEAGTGKSHTLNAVRDAYEGVGKTVIGLAWTNDVAQQMKGDGFDQAATVARELGAIEKGRKHWTRDTVVIVDEAAMLSTGALNRLAIAAERSGAKLILAGDDAQLPSIERGGMFETLRQTHGAAILKDVQRVKEADQQAAFNQMHKREFQDALQTFDKAGGIHWTKAQSDTLKDMAARYTADVAADDDKKRFMFAYTNKDVAALNTHARELHKARGDLGDDYQLPTKHGAAEFAEGDRIQFTGNGRTERARDAGLVNGRVGTVEAIDLDNKGRFCLTVALDAKTGQKSPRLTFAVGEDTSTGEFNSFKHGYAGTVYRGQGKTLDQTYIAYTPHMKASAAYVALTRHREDVQIFAARETVKDLDAMASAMSRTEGKRAASAYVIDAATVLEVAKELDAGMYATPAAQTVAGETIARVGEAMDNANVATIENFAIVDGLAEPTQAAVVAAPSESLTEGAEPTAAEEIQGDAPREKAIDVGGAALGKATQILGAAFSAIMGETPKAAPPMTAKERHAKKVQDFLDAEREQRKANLQEIARSLGVSDGRSPEELQLEKDAQEKRSRDRGGGQSL